MSSGNPEAKSAWAVLPARMDGKGARLSPTASRGKLFNFQGETNCWDGSWCSNLGEECSEVDREEEHLTGRTRHDERYVDVSPIDHLVSSLLTIPRERRWLCDKMY